LFQSEHTYSVGQSSEKLAKIVPVPAISCLGKNWEHKRRKKETPGKKWIHRFKIQRAISKTGAKTENWLEDLEISR
jgi:hypothetical protein